MTDGTDGTDQTKVVHEVLADLKTSTIGDLWSSAFFCETQELTDFFCIHHTLKSDSASIKATDQTYLVKINSENCTNCT